MSRLKFKFLGASWDFTPVAILLFGVWGLFLMFPVWLREGASLGAILFYIASVVITLSLLPTFDKWFSGGNDE